MNHYTTILLLLLYFPSAFAQDVDVIYVPTQEPVLQAMLKLAGVDSTDVVYDLGSGDGRIVITAATQYGAKGVGIDIDPQSVKEANENAVAANVTHLVKFRQGDLFKADFREATVVTIYLMSGLNLMLRPILMRQLKPGARVVSHAFHMGDWEPDESIEVDGTTIYLWRIPEE